MIPGSVSIVIPSYNLGVLLRETVHSIEAARTPALREVIIVDDGSTDPETLKVLRELESTYTVVLQTNRGLGAARNAGIRLATGEFILPVDSDNGIRRPYLAEGPDMFCQDPDVGIVYGDAEYIGDRSGRWYVPEFDLARLVDANFIDACALFRKHVWEDVGGYDEHPPHLGWEDWDFWLRASVKGWRFVHLNEVAWEYRVRAGSMMSGVNAHAKVMDHHLFTKKELAPLGYIRADVHRLLNIEQSMEYRLGKRLLGPVRGALARLHRGRSWGEPDSVREQLTSPTTQK
jgi:glycosyltransferase involved in cell wall biosynthesis